MKAIIAGGRDFRALRKHAEFIDRIHAETPLSLVISGACGISGEEDNRHTKTAKGADGFGEKWADLREIPLLRKYAYWKLGTHEGPARNERMAEMADALILFPGGRGSASMKRIADEHKLKVFEWVE